MTQSRQSHPDFPRPASANGRFSAKNNQLYVGVFLLLLSVALGTIAFFVPSPFQFVFASTAVFAALGGILRFVVASRLPRNVAGAYSAGNDDPQVKELTTRYVWIRVIGLAFKFLMLVAVLVVILGRSEVALVVGLCILVALIGASIVTRVLARRVLKSVAARRAELESRPHEAGAK